MSVGDDWSLCQPRADFTTFVRPLATQLFTADALAGEGVLEELRAGPGCFRSGGRVGGAGHLGGGMAVSADVIRGGELVSSRPPIRGGG